MFSSRSKRIGLLTSLSLSVVLSIALVVILMRHERRLMSDYRDHIDVTNSILIAAIKDGMAEGASHPKAFVDELGHLADVKEIRLLPTNRVRPGSETAMDSWESAVVSSRMASVRDEQFKEASVTRTISPVLADDRCVRCHPGSAVGDPLAVISVRFSPEQTQEAILADRWLSLGVGLSALVILFILVANHSNKLIRYATQLPRQLLERLAVGDLDTDDLIQPSNPPDGFEEKDISHLRTIAQTFRENLRKKTESVLQIARGDLSREIPVSSDKDSLGKAIRTVHENLKRMAADTRTLAHATAEGNLAARLNAEPHKGEMRTIVENINTSLDSMSAPLTMSSECLSRLSLGDLPENGSEECRGDVLGIKQNLRKCVDTVAGLLADITTTAEAAAEGNLSVRIDEGKYQGGFRTIAEKVNETTDALIGPLRTLAACLEGIGKGDIPAQISDLFKGELKTARDNANHAIDQMRALGDESLRLSKATVEGSLTVRADLSRHQGDFRRVFEVVNGTLDALAGSLTVATEYIDRISRGDIPKELAESLPGSLNAIRTSVNHCIQTTNNLVADVGVVSQDAVAGRLAARLDPARHPGAYRKMVEAVNTALDALTEPVKEAVNVLTDMAHGDLSPRLRGEYSGNHELLKSSINAVAESFDDTIRSVSKSVDAAAKATDEIASGTTEMAAGAHEQHSQVTEVATATEEITRSIGEISQNNLSAAQTAKDAKEAAKEGGKSVTETIEGIRRLGTTVQNFASTMITLSSSSEQIGEIVGVIDDIADQTNLLALNAAIEAARAGEEGRGFSVVADEVRKLAERTSQATKEISGMIKNIQSETAAAKEQVGNGIEEVDKVISQGERAEATLQGIVEISEVISELLEQIANASEQQASASEQVSKSIEGISAVTAETAERIQRISEHSEDFRGIVTTLRTSISRFCATESPAGSYLSTPKEKSHSRGTAKV